MVATINLALQPAAEGSASPLVRLEAVKKAYVLGRTRVPALRGVDLSLAVGEFAALIGPSGSGKSTLLNICGLVDSPDAGRVWMGGTALENLSTADLTQLRRDRIGFVFQGFNLVPVMTVFENVEYPLFLAGMGAKERHRKVREMLARVGLADFERRRPDELSGGQRQRVAIARALVKRPALVIADEPTANLDSATADVIIALMHELGRAEGTSFLIATHDARLTAHCDRSIRLHDGVLQ